MFCFRPLRVWGSDSTCLRSNREELRSQGWEQGEESAPRVGRSCPDPSCPSPPPHTTSAPPTSPPTCSIPQRAPFSTLEIPFDLGNKITVSTDDFEGTCEPPNPLPHDSSFLLVLETLGHKLAERQKLSTCGVWGGEGGEVQSEEANVLR